MFDDGHLGWNNVKINGDWSWWTADPNLDMDCPSSLPINNPNAKRYHTVKCILCDPGMNIRTVHWQFLSLSRLVVKGGC